MTTRTREMIDTGSVPLHLVIGAALIAIAWPMAWFGPEPFSRHTFFPLWLGYILTIDGLTVVRSGTSLLTRNPARFALLFAFSVPLWWIFEFANQFLQNWHYHMPRDYSTLTYALLSSLSFSTVMPAIFVTAEFWRTVPMFQREVRWRRIAPGRGALIAIAASGLVMCVASLVFPSVLFPLIWIGGFVLVDPINALTGGRSVTAQIARGRWDTVLVLFAAGLTCGFFWEMWNYFAMPKWIYQVPWLNRFHLFEMPLVGYLGYLPFGPACWMAWLLLSPRRAAGA